LVGIKKTHQPKFHFICKDFDSFNFSVLRDVNGIVR